MAGARAQAGQLQEERFQDWYGGYEFQSAQSAVAVNVAAQGPRDRPVRHAHNPGEQRALATFLQSWCQVWKSAEAIKFLRPHEARGQQESQVFAYLCWRSLQERARLRQITDSES